jgi:hypothetical protein
MENGNWNSPGVEALVISDNRRLSRATGFALRSLLGLVTVELAPDAPGQQKRACIGGDPALIVFALSSAVSEPIAELARAVLDGKIGQVPLLVISDQGSEADSHDMISYLHFPFDPHELCEKVREILG